MQVECCGTCDKLMITKDYQNGNKVVNIFCRYDKSEVGIFDSICCIYKEFEDSFEYISSKLLD